MKAKLKVGCLHGYGTNSKFLERQMRSFIKAFSSQFEFIFLQAPFNAPKQFILDEKVLKLIKGDTKSWTPSKSFRHEKTQFTNELIQKLNQILQSSSNHYDGFIGFSQGAVIVHFILKMIQAQRLKLKCIQKVKFCMLICANHWHWENFEESPIKVPSIHLISPADFLFRKSIFTTSEFEKPLVLYHESGHSFPRLGTEEKNKISQYLKQNIDKQDQSVLYLISKL